MTISWKMRQFVETASCRLQERFKQQDAAVDGLSGRAPLNDQMDKSDAI